MFSLFKIYVDPKYTAKIRVAILLVLALIVGQFTRISYWFIIGITVQENHTDLSFYLHKYLKSNFIALITVPALLIPLHIVGGPYNLQLFLLGVFVILALESMISKRAHANVIHACVLNFSLAPSFPLWRDVLYIYPVALVQRVFWIGLGAFSAYIVNIRVVSANQQVTLVNHLKYLQSLALDLIDRIYDDPINLHIHEHTMLTLESNLNIFIKMLMAIYSELAKYKYVNIQIYLESIQQLLNFYCLLVHLDPQSSHKHAVTYFRKKIEILKDILIRQYSRIEEKPINLLK
jgi:hypothetical protein